MLIFAAGCSKDKDVEPPAKLVNFPATLPVKKLWGDNVGGGKKQVKLRLGLGPAVDNGIVFAASDKGELLAVSLDTGRQVWVKKLELAAIRRPRRGAWDGGGRLDQGCGHRFRRRDRPGALALPG